MKAMAGFWFVAVLMVMSFPALSATGKDPRDGVLEGTIIDTQCYMTMNMTGGGHQQCAVTCLKDGAPVGVLDKNGNVAILVTSNSAAFSDVANKPCKVQGKVYGHGKGMIVVPEKIWVEGKPRELPKGMM